MNERDYFVEDAKSEQILFKGNEGRMRILERCLYKREP